MNYASNKYKVRVECKKSIDRKETSFIDYLVVYLNKIGDIEKVAMTIFNALLGKSKDVQRVEELKGGTDTYFVGLRNNRGAYSGEIVELLSRLPEKKVALFGTCDISGSQECLETMVNQVEASIPDDCEYLDAFMCAGRMPLQIPERYKQTQKVNDNPQVRTMIKAHKKGVLCPSNDDSRHAREFVGQVIEEER